VIPVSAPTMDEALSTTYAVYQAAASLGRDRYDVRSLTADEGGTSPAVRQRRRDAPSHRRGDRAGWF
jgi:enolase